MVNGKVGVGGERGERWGGARAGGYCTDGKCGGGGTEEVVQDRGALHASGAEDGDSFGVGHGEINFCWKREGLEWYCGGYIDGYRESQQSLLILIEAKEVPASHPPPSSI